MRIINQSNCIICSSQSLSKKMGVVSPWVAKRVWDRLPFIINLIACGDCGFTYFDIRLDDSEMARLYDGYWGAEYQKLRQRYEPWYTQKINILISNNSAEIISRKIMLQNLLSNVGITKINNILDYGGDRGQFIPEIYNAERYVSDISNVKLVDGVKRLSEHKQFDLIICSNVLEHVSYPNTIIEKIKTFTHKYSILFIEVPSEINSSNFIRTLPILDKVRIPFLFNLKRRIMTEHINYFTEKSVKVMLKDMDILYLKTIEKDLKWNKEKVICCLARAS